MNQTQRNRAKNNVPVGLLFFSALGQQSFGYLGGSTAHTIRPGLSWLLNLYFLPSREPPAAPLVCPKPQLQMNKHDIKADIGLAPRIWAHILPNFQIKQLLSLKWFQERMVLLLEIINTSSPTSWGIGISKCPSPGPKCTLLITLFRSDLCFKNGLEDCTIP